MMSRIGKEIGNEGRRTISLQEGFGEHAGRLFIGGHAGGPNQPVPQRNCIRTPILNSIDHANRTHVRHRFDMPGGGDKWHRLPLNDRHGKAGGMPMPATPMSLRDPRHFGATTSRAKADISPPLTLVPHETKGMVNSQAFAQLAAENGAVNSRDRLALEAHQHGSPQQITDQLLLGTENRPSFRRQLIPLQSAPHIKVERVGFNRRIDCSTLRQLPAMEIFILHILQQPGRSRPMRPFPHKHGAGFILLIVS